MRIVRITLGASVLAGIAALSGCGGFERAERPAWRGEAERACLRSGALSGLPGLEPARAIEGPGICGIEAPLKVASLPTEFTASIGEGGAIATSFSPAATIGCPMTAATAAWLNAVVQPSALAFFGTPVAELSLMGSYACRTRNNRRGAKLSEHAFANALDIGGFVLADGRRITVKRGWKGAADESGFLRTVHRGACDHFRTVLGPGSDMFHYDHLHVDLARHGRNGTATVCRPKIDPPPPPDAVWGGEAPMKPIAEPAFVDDPAEFDIEQ
jgi:hypothetical protein